MLDECGLFVHESVDNAVVNKLSRALSFNQMKCERSSSILAVCLAAMEGGGDNLRIEAHGIIEI